MKSIISKIVVTSVIVAGLSFNIQASPVHPLPVDTGKMSKMKKMDKMKMKKEDKKMSSKMMKDTGKMSKM